MGARVNYSGLVVAGVGFFLTRFTVTLAIYETPIRFYLAGFVPLAIGLGLAAFGVALAVADVDAAVARTTALWCVIGFGTMLVLVVLTLLGATPGTDVDFTTARSQTYLSNFLIGGSVGGTLTGLYAARNRRQRVELTQQRNRLVTLNRLLRHEVLNAVTAIRGWANVDQTKNPQAMSVIDDRGDDIQQTIEDVKYLTGEAGSDGTPLTPVDVDAALTESVERVTAQYPDVSVARDTVSDVCVHANERLSQVFGHLLENAVVHGDDNTPDVEVSTTARTVAVSISDDGDGLPSHQQRLLETGDISEFDNPRKGFGLNVVRLLVESYGGAFETTVDDDGTTVTVVLSRTVDDTGQQPSRGDLTGVRPALPHLAVSLVAALLAGVFYGIASELLGGSVAAIGVFYGTSSTVVGWLTHEFHSVVFGFVYVGLLSVAFERVTNSIRTYLAIGILWSLTLWTVAAGVVAPLWLRILGIPAAIPSLSVSVLISHIVWGVSLALLTAWGYRYVTPVLARLDTGLRPNDEDP
jgi:signal transduction histidine kinase